MNAEHLLQAANALTEALTANRRHLHTIPGTDLT